MFDVVARIEQSKSDLMILQKYNHHLRSHHDQLNQLLSFASRQHHEYLHAQSRANRQTFFENQLHSNHIHHWHTLKITSPETFDKLSKMVLIKKKLVDKSNELARLKEIFQQKATLSRYLSSISRRRERLIK